MIFVRCVRQGEMLMNTSRWIMIFFGTLILATTGCTQFRQFQQNKPKCISVIIFMPIDTSPKHEEIRRYFVKSLKNKCGKKLRFLLQRVKNYYDSKDIIQKRIDSNPSLVVTIGKGAVESVFKINQNKIAGINIEVDENKSARQAGTKGSSDAWNIIKPLLF
jgi:hypothetical protein